MLGLKLIVQVFWSMDNLRGYTYMQLDQRIDDSNGCHI